MGLKLSFKMIWELSWHQKRPLRLETVDICETKLSPDHSHVQLFEGLSYTRPACLMMSPRYLLFFISKETTKNKCILNMYNLVEVNAQFIADIHSVKYYA